MSDRIKFLLAGASLIGSLVLPLVGLIYGWWNWNVGAGLIIMAGIFLILMVFSGFLLFHIRDLSWLSVYIPFIFGTVYGFLPDSILYSIDDAAATTVGAILSYGLALKKQPGTSKWIIIPLLAAGIYAFFGGNFLGPVDEFLVDAVALILAWVVSRQTRDLEIESNEM
jgi:hypothetical protein